MAQLIDSSHTSTFTNDTSEARQHLKQAITRFDILWTKYSVAHDLPILNQLEPTKDEEAWFKYGQYIVANKSLFLAYNFPPTSIDEVTYWLRQVQDYDDYHNKSAQPIVVKDISPKTPTTLFLQQMSHFIVIFFTACLCLTFAISSLIMFFNTML